MNYENVASTRSGSSPSTTTRVLVCAGVLLIIVLVLGFVANGTVNAVNVVYALHNLVIPSVITILWARGSEAKSSWGWIAGIFLGVFVAVEALQFLADSLARLVSGAH